MASIIIDIIFFILLIISAAILAHFSIRMFDDIHQIRIDFDIIAHYLEKGEDD